MFSGLYNVNDHRDSCGFGLIAHIKGNASHNLVSTAIDSLSSMAHRGGVAADGKTGDGCGLLISTPVEFLCKIARESCSINLDISACKKMGVGVVFLNPDSDIAANERRYLSDQISAAGLKIIGWRKVPVNPQVCGPMATEKLPLIEQFFVSNCSFNSAQMEARLFIARRKTELSINNDEYFFICSLSTKQLVYKALVMPGDLATFYPDLQDKTLKTSICVFHLRFSTNTLPEWRLAQPFRMLAHNGEINTIAGNRNWIQARNSKFQSKLLSDLAMTDLTTLTPLISQSGSDSLTLDNMLELLVSGGMDIYRALRLLIPPAWQNTETLDEKTKAFYEYSSFQMEPWDGPAGIVLTDGRRAICLLDRNGLRPARYAISKNGFITLASETGTSICQSNNVVTKGRIGPGQIISIDTETGEILLSEDIDNNLKQKNPYRQWLIRQKSQIGDTIEEVNGHNAIGGEDLLVFMKQFQFTAEELESVLIPLAKNGQEAIGSMGDDTPIAVLSTQPRSLFDYFRQQFAQVTNPAIDSLRESVVMSLTTSFGRELNIFEETEEHAHWLVSPSPILSPEEYNKLLEHSHADYKVCVIDLNFNPLKKELRQAIQDVTVQAEHAVTSGYTIIVLSDRKIDIRSIPIPAVLATGATHHHLINIGQRCNSNIVIETASARDSHHIAVLLGFGATAIYPFFAYAVLDDLVQQKKLPCDRVTTHQNLIKGLNKGLLKIMSKMGISTIASYRGAQLFEALGISTQVIDLCFTGVTSRIQGIGFEDIQKEQQTLASAAWNKQETISRGGILKYVYGSEYHAFSPDIVSTLQEAVQNNDYSRYRDYAGLVNSRPIAVLRDLLEIKTGMESIPLSDVEPVDSILKRFDSAGMSLGALSPEAHESLAIAMNRMGARSNSGEGGEDADRFQTDRVSKIKQVASGRFGVTPHYLVNAEVIQIKIAQGSKPGEGGQLPGEKVNDVIAKLRFCAAGSTLISPPPHHDIYSIEDLAQLIFDLKQVNPMALVSVKLVSEPGVGCIACGVAKAYADLITISGHDGGTAASPLSSIRYAGSPWELGLSETHQALRANGLRDVVRLQADGGMKTGLDVVKAAILGAESFGFGTAPMVALGCKYLRICHLNNCATGVATQNQTLRSQHYIGTVEMVINYFSFVAQETRELLAHLGVKKLQDLIGRTDLLTILPGTTYKQKKLDLSGLIDHDLVEDRMPQFCSKERNTPWDKGELAEKIIKSTIHTIDSKTGGDFEFTITNRDRSIGARVSGEIVKRYGSKGMNKSPLTIFFSGTAGQSFGVWNASGLNLVLSGDANDYVGKGMAGGRIVIHPPHNSLFESHKTVIVGNTCLYGATGGLFYAAGLAGERFAVRNSGCTAVVEGAGDHCCEYMTGGSVVVLGGTGCNFGAGMTGGFALVLDLTNQFTHQLNREFVDLFPISNTVFEPYRNYLFTALQQHVLYTKSHWGQKLIDDFPEYLGKFWLVKPRQSNLSSLPYSVQHPTDQVHAQ